MMQVVLPPLFLFPVILVLTHQLTPANGGHILAISGEYSHWLNMRTILDELVRRNHTVTILVMEVSPSVDYNNPAYAGKFNFLVFKVPFTKSEQHGLTEELIHFSMFEAHHLSTLQKIHWTHVWMQRAIKNMMQLCDSLLNNQQLIATMRDARFDAMLFDPVCMCGDLLADVLGVPFIISLRFSFGGVLERHCGHTPAPPSYVPVPPLTYSDQMTFMERLINTVSYATLSGISEMFWWLNVDKFYTEVKGTPTRLCESIGKAEIWLIRTFWDLEMPRPLPPNFKYVGGLHCKPANRLPEEMEAFVQSSGEAGVVVVSFGSMISNLTTERADVIATALGQIPQKVIWKFRGNKPNTLAPNTRVFNWIPQNDVLGHPKTRVFVTHGGTNGLYEAIYHAVPLVGIPMFADQPDNLARFTRRGAAIVLNFNTLTSNELTQALQDVINQPSYKSNMQHLSDLHHDQPVSPLDTAVYWVEFVMRHGGAQHLRLASRDLNWFQYHSLDVIAALLIGSTIICVLCWTFICRLMRGCRSRLHKKKD